MAKLKTEREQAVRAEAEANVQEKIDKLRKQGKLKKDLSPEQLEKVIQKEIENLSKERHADIVEPMDPSNDKGGVRIKELKSTEKGFNEHDVMQIRDYIKAAQDGAMIGEPPREVKAVTVKFSDEGGVRGSAAELAAMLSEGLGKFSFEAIDPETGEFKLYNREDFQLKGKQMNEAQIKARLEEMFAAPDGSDGG